MKRWIFIVAVLLPSLVNGQVPAENQLVNGNQLQWLIGHWYYQPTGSFSNTTQCFTNDVANNVNLKEEFLPTNALKLPVYSQLIPEFSDGCGTSINHWMRFSPTRQRPDNITSPYYRNFYYNYLEASSTVVKSYDGYWALTIDNFGSYDKYNVTYTNADTTKNIIVAPNATKVYFIHDNFTLFPPYPSVAYAWLNLKLFYSSSGAQPANSDSVQFIMSCEGHPGNQHVIYMKVEPGHPGLQYVTCNILDPITGIPNPVNCDITVNYTYTPYGSSPTTASVTLPAGAGEVNAASGEEGTPVYINSVSPASCGDINVAYSNSSLPDVSVTRFYAVSNPVSCSSSTIVYLYSHAAPEDNTVVYSDPFLTTGAANGYYSDGSNFIHVSSSQVDVSGRCGGNYQAFSVVFNFSSQSICNPGNPIQTIYSSERFSFYDFQEGDKVYSNSNGTAYVANGWYRDPDSNIVLHILSGKVVMVLLNAC